MGLNALFMGRRGIYFTIDAFLALSILFLTMLLLSSFIIPQTGQTSQSSVLARDAVRLFTVTEVGELQNPYVEQLVADQTIENENATIFEQLGYFWALGQDDQARDFIASVTDELFPDQFGYRILIDGDEIYSNNATEGALLISSRKLITGIEREKPTEGFTSRTFLKSITEKELASYAYFGGFVGQGNVSVTITDIPSNVTVTGIEIELDAGTEFTLSVNDQRCGGLYYPLQGNMTATSWNVSSCSSDVETGADNEFSFGFPADISNAFVGGGFVKVSYATDQFAADLGSGTKRQLLPEIIGVINLYSSFFVPGNLTSLDLSLHYDAGGAGLTNTLYATIGNTTVLQLRNLSGEGTVNLTDANFSMLDYASLSERTVPLRVGFENVSYETFFEGAADTMIITDLSGSMDWRMDTDNVDGTNRNCDDASLDDGSTQRLSVAKCLDKEFAGNILNISGNKAGLVAFESSTVDSSTVTPTTDLSTINDTIGTASPETGYSASGGTCICCGINSATSVLTEGISVTSYIGTGSDWLYYTGGYDGDPAADPSGTEWYEEGYANETDWGTGAAILGATNGESYSPAVNTEIGSDLTGAAEYADLWEHGDDSAGPPNDFSSGVLNSSSNTYGWNQGDDGWDWDFEDGNGPYGFDDDVTYNGVSGGELSFDMQQGGSNQCQNGDCSGGYGVEFEITDEIYAVLNSSGRATVSFSYSWQDNSGNAFESCDQAWVKARMTDSTGSESYLGSDLDSGMQGADIDNEAATVDNPNTDLSGSYSTDVSSIIDGPGTYYLDIGGKMRADVCWSIFFWSDDTSEEHGSFTLDDIQLMVSNSTDHYYFRKHFTIADAADARRGIVNVLSDERATIYVNGNKVDEDFTNHSAEYWNRRGMGVPGSYLQEGDNVVAAKVINTNGAAKFDLEFLGINTSREKAMLVMTDGVATEGGSCPQSGTPTEQAVRAACEAREDYGISVYAVGYSDTANEQTLEDIAACGEGQFVKSSDVSTLQNFYQDVASSIISASRHSQTVEVEGEVAASTLYGDSYLEMGYTPAVTEAEFDEIELDFEQPAQGCSFTMTDYESLRVTDMKLTSYSSEHWTDLLRVNGEVVYNLSSYDEQYTTLGDPFVVDVPPSALVEGENTFFLKTGDTPQNNTGCSQNNTLIYTAMLRASVSYEQVHPQAEGCEWTVETVSGTRTLSIPADYSGADACSYTSASVSYDTDDGIDQSAHSLLSQLDFDDDNIVDVDITENDLEIEALYVSEVPSLWGPAIAEVQVWQR